MSVAMTNKQVPDNMILGYLAFYSLGDIKVDHGTLCIIFSQAGLPNSYIRKISPADAFRRASSSIKNVQFALSSGAEVRVEVDEIACTADGGIKRAVGLKCVDKKKETVKYDTAAVLEFDRTTNTVSKSVVNAFATETMFNIILEKAVDNYNEWTQYHNADTIRNLISRIISHMHPVTLNAGRAFKFVPKAHANELYSVKQVITDLNAYRVPGSAKENYMDILPVIDTEEQQSIVKQAAESQLKQDMFAFTQELKNVLQQKGALPTKTMKSYLARFGELKAAADDYEALFGTYLDALRMQIKEAVKLVNDNAA